MNKRIILVGPTAGGKNFIREKFAEKGYKADCSYTSREPRSGEIDGVDYKFITKADFKRRIEQNAFYEYVEYGDNFYGTGKSEWKDCDIFIMETDGIRHIKSKDKQDCVVIFINTPLSVRIERMLQREWSEEKISERIAVDSKKFRNFTNYDLQISSETHPFE